MSTRTRAARRSGAARRRRALVLVACGMLSAGLSACESTEQESAKIGRENAAAARAVAAQQHATTRAHGHAHSSTDTTKTKHAGSP
jgi:hypothetical protein